MTEDPDEIYLKFLNIGRIFIATAVGGLTLSSIKKRLYFQLLENNLFLLCYNLSFFQQLWEGNYLIFMNTRGVNFIF